MTTGRPPSGVGTQSSGRSADGRHRPHQSARAESSRLYRAAPLSTPRAPTAQERLAWRPFPIWRESGERDRGERGTERGRRGKGGTSAERRAHAERERERERERDEDAGYCATHVRAKWITAATGVIDLACTHSRSRCDRRRELLLTLVSSNVRIAPLPLPLSLSTPSSSTALYVLFFSTSTSTSICSSIYSGKAEIGSLANDNILVDSWILTPRCGPISSRRHPRAEDDRGSVSSDHLARGSARITH